MSFIVLEKENGAILVVIKIFLWTHLFFSLVEALALKAMAKNAMELFFSRFQNLLYSKLTERRNNIIHSVG